MSNFVKIFDADQLNPGQVTMVTVKGHDVCIANVEGEFFALDNKCPHRGGFRMPPDIAKAIALGADAVAAATSAMIAIGCQQYRACSSNNCPVGITTQRADLRGRFSIAESSRRLVNFLAGTRYQLTEFARMCGRRRLADLSLADVVTYNEDLARYTSIRHAAQPFPF